MHYHLHITRNATSWRDEHDPAAITLAEWEAYVASDVEMRLENDPRGEADQGYLAALAEADSAVVHASRSRWLAYSRDGQPGRTAWFYHEGDHVTVSGPDEEILGKMLRIAHALGARVQGDDNEYFDEDMPGAGQGGADDTNRLNEYVPAFGPQPEADRPAWVTSDFRDFQTFASPEAAQPLLAALGQRGIGYRTLLDTGQVAFDPSFANNQLTSKFVVKLLPADFEQGNQLLADLHAHALRQLSPDHYLFKFTDEELFDILVKPDEWSALDVALASQLLRQRGRDISADTLQLLRQRRVAELTQPDQPLSGWVRAGYFLALLGGLAGIAIGFQLYFGRKQLPTGQRIPTYSPTDRVHGLRILVLGVFMFLLLLTVRLLRANGGY